MNKNKIKNLMIKPSIDKVKYTFNTTPHEFLYKHFQVEHPLDKFRFNKIPRELLFYEQEDTSLYIKNGHRKSYVETQGSTFMRTAE